MARLAALSLLLSAAGGSGGAFYDAETARVTASPLPRAPAPAWLRPLARDGVGSAERAAAHTSRSGTDAARGLPLGLSVL
eukprot:COSAG04_NODE_13540_length_601_cov_27.533865_2_plen_79_part_01